MPRKSESDWLIAMALGATGSEPTAEDEEGDDFEDDGTHPSTAGQTMVAELLMTHFLTAPATRGWFAATGTGP